MPLAPVLERIDHARDAIVDLTRRLVSIPTQNPPGKCYRECADLLASQLGALGLEAETIEVPANGATRYIVLAGVGAGATLYLHGHYDVVPASANRQFRPEVQDGCLSGRGSADMKGGVAAMVFALAALRDENLSGRVEAVFVPDEETGGRHGSQHLASIDRLGRDGLGAIVGEPTSGVVWNANRGAITIRVSLRGEPAHVGLHYEGRNAFEGALPILRALLELKLDVQRRRTSFAIAPQEARSSILMLGGQVAGAHQFNVVPDRFSFTVERRFNPEEDLEAERARLLETILETAPADLKVDVEYLQEGSSGSAEEATRLGLSLSRAIGQVEQRAPSFELCPGLLETRFYAAKGVDAMAYGPGLLSVSHGPHEYVEIQRLIDCCKVYAATALDLLGSEIAT